MAKKTLDKLKQSVRDLHKRVIARGRRYKWSADGTLVDYDLIKEGIDGLTKRKPENPDEDLLG